MFLYEKDKWANEKNICVYLPPLHIPCPCPCLTVDIINNKSFTGTNLTQEQQYLSPYLRRLVKKYKRIYIYVVLDLFRQLNQDFY